MKTICHASSLFDLFSRSQGAQANALSGRTSEAAASTHCHRLLERTRRKVSRLVALILERGSASSSSRPNRDQLETERIATKAQRLGRPKVMDDGIVVVYNLLAIGPNEDTVPAHGKKGRTDD